MSDDLNEFLSDDQPQAQSGGGMRAKLEAALAKLKELEVENSTLKDRDRERAVSTVWDELGVPAKWRKAYLGEKNPDAIKAWWTDLAVPEALLEDDTNDGQSRETDAQREQREQLSAHQQASQLGSPSTSGSGAFDARAREVANKGRGASQADRASLYADLGVPQY